MLTDQRLRPYPTKPLVEDFAVAAFERKRDAYIAGMERASAISAAQAVNMSAPVSREAAVKEATQLDKLEDVLDGLIDSRTELRQRKAAREAGFQDLPPELFEAWRVLERIREVNAQLRELSDEGLYVVREAHDSAGPRFDGGVAGIVSDAASDSLDVLRGGFDLSGDVSHEDSPSVVAPVLDTPDAPKASVGDAVGSGSPSSESAAPSGSHVSLIKDIAALIASAYPRASSASKDDFDLILADAARRLKMRTNPPPAAPSP